MYKFYMKRVWLTKKEATQKCCCYGKRRGMMKAGCKQRATKGWIPRGAFSYKDFYAIGLLPNLPKTFIFI